MSEEISNINEIANFEIVPYEIDEVYTNCKKISIGNIAALGVAFDPLASFIQSAAGKGGGSGLYYVNTKGMTMASFKDGSGYLGSLLKNNNQVGGGQAVINPAFNPTMLFMAAALSSIEQKLDNIAETQKEILDFLKQKETAKLKGNVNTLHDIYSNYKHNWNNDKYKTNKHILVQDIKRDAEQSLFLYRSLIEEELSKNKRLHIDKDVKTYSQVLQDSFKNYQLALYMYSFAAFLEVLLLENYNSQYLSDASAKIKDYSFSCRKLYTECCGKIEDMSRSSVQSNIVKGLAGLSKNTGKTIAKMPLISKSQLDEKLMETGDKLYKSNDDKNAQTTEHLMKYSSGCIYKFAENIDTINKLYNKPVKIMFDSQNIYIAE